MTKLLILIDAPHLSSINAYLFFLKPSRKITNAATRICHLLLIISLIVTISIWFIKGCKNLTITYLLLIIEEGYLLSIKALIA
jgi:hypothetical protein